MLTMISHCEPVLLGACIVVAVLLPVAMELAGACLRRSILGRFWRWGNAFATLSCNCVAGKLLLVEAGAHSGRVFPVFVWMMLCAVAVALLLKHCVAFRLGDGTGGVVGLLGVMAGFFPLYAAIMPISIAVAFLCYANFRDFLFLLCGVLLLVAPFVGVPWMAFGVLVVLFVCVLLIFSVTPNWSLE